MSIGDHFTDIDLFAYMASGLAAFLFCDLAFGTHLVLAAEWTASSGTLTLAGAYVLGQIIASPASHIVERGLVRDVLFPPSVALFASRELGWRKILARTVLHDYYAPFDDGIKTKVLARAKAEHGGDVSGEALFWCAFPVAKNDATAYARMQSFLKLYEFCRNLAFVSIIGAIVLGVNAVWAWSIDGWQEHASGQAWWALLALLAAVGLFLRYLMFLRLYSREIFVTYSTGDRKAGKDK